MHNFLTDPLFTVCAIDGHTLTVDLPTIFELAAADEIDTFPRLRPHQRPALHAFLVQLGCIACEAANLEAPPDRATAWRDVLRGLTATWPDDSPWHLIVEDLSQPALLQPPQPNGAPALKTWIEHPDKLDLLVTSKNHDLKQRRMAHGRPEDWFFALLSLQTQEGFLGAGNYGIARMNGGFANRSFLTLAPEAARFGGRVFRDMRRVLADLDGLYEAAGLGEPHGPSLLWLPPWDGAGSIAVDDCHPLFIEVCRRIRLAIDGDHLGARAGNSKKPRVDAKALAGNVGDPWLPLDIQKEPKAMTLSASGFTYRRMAQLLSGVESKYQLPFLAKPAPDERERPLAYEAFGLVRGQGKTEGFHTRRVSVPPQIVAYLSDTDLRTQLARRSKLFLDLAAHASGKALRPALIQLFQGKDNIEWTKPSNESLCRPWLDRMDAEIDAAFFHWLFDLLPRSAEIAEQRFSRYLEGIANDVLAAAAEATPQSPQRQDFARARAELLLSRSLRKHLPALRLTVKETTDDHAA